MVNSTTTPEQSRRDTINHLRWQAKAVDQQTTLDTTTRLADELAADLATLARGAA